MCRIRIYRPIKGIQETRGTNREDKVNKKPKRNSSFAVIKGQQQTAGTVRQRDFSGSFSQQLCADWLFYIAYCISRLCINLLTSCPILFKTDYHSLPFSKLKEN